MTVMLTHTALRRAHQLPPALDDRQLSGLLNGALSAPTRQAVRAQLAVDFDHGEYDSFFGPQHTPTDQLPDARVWVGRFAIALVECLAGLRPPSQLGRHLTTDVLARVNRRHRLVLRRGRTRGATRLLRVRVCAVRDGVVEAAIAARINGRSTPIALRLNGADGRWQVTVLDML